MAASLREKLAKVKRSVVPTDYKVKEIPERRFRILKSVARLLRIDTELIQKTKTVIPKYSWDMEPRLRRPEYDYVTLVDKANKSWPLRRVFNTIIKECTRNFGHIENRFLFKCTQCGLEYSNQVEECVCGSKDFKQPDPKQLLRLKKLIKNPSPDRTFLEFIRTTLFYELATDEVYWSIVENQNGTEIHVEHPGYIFPLSERFGYLGSYQYFCPTHYIEGAKQGHDIFYDMKNRIDPYAKERPVFQCPKCNEVMVETAYVQEIAGQITARFGKNEIVHGSFSRLAPELFGNPRLASLLKLIHTLQSIDDYKLETHAEGKVGGLLAFPQLDQERVTEILREIKRERESLTKRDEVTGELETSKRTALIFIGLDEGGKPIKIPFLDKEEEMQTLGYYQLYLSAIDEVYGVSTHLQVAKKGTGTKAIRSQIEVNRDTALEQQRFFMELFNEDLLLKLGITDWVWVFDKLEPKDALRDTEVLHQKAAAALTAANAGFEVEWVGDEVRISGKAAPTKGTRTGLPNVEPGVAPRRMSRTFIAPFEISPATGEEITAIEESFSERLAEGMLRILHEARERAHAGKENLSAILTDTRSEMFRLLQRSALRLDKKEALYAEFDKLISEIFGDKS